MKIVFNTEELEHIADGSFYNHNYYYLPVSINGCNILYEVTCDMTEHFSYEIGFFDKENKGRFKVVHSFEENDDGACWYVIGD